MKKIILFAAASIVSAGMIFTSCRKEKKDSDTNATVDNNMAQYESDQIDNFINYAADDNNVRSSSALPSCATVSLDTVSSPRSLTITFDTVNGCVCTGWDGRTRKGQIIVTWTGHYRDSGTVIHTTTDNYYVNGNLCVYDKTVTNMGHNTSGNIYFSVVVNTAEIHTTTGTISWISSRTREWIAGYSTLTPWDDEYKITGTADGTSRSGQAFHVEVGAANPLHVKLSCLVTGNYPIVDGIMTISISGLSDRVVNFGSGDCDNLAVVTINGNDYQINL